MKLSNKTYDILKKIALYLPAVATFILGVSTVWDLQISDKISQTVALVVTLINTVLGVTVDYSSMVYQKNKQEEVG